MSATRAEKVMVQAGVGIVLEEKRANASFQLVVVKLVEGGPAHSSRKIQVGDVLIQVDGRDVYRSLLEHVVPMIVGQEGSTVKLVFERGDHRSPVTCFLVRGDHREGLARPWGTSPTAPASGGVLLRRQNPPTNPPMHEVGGARVSHSGVHSVEPGSPTTGRTGRKSDAVFPSLDFFSGMAGAPASVDKSTVKRASPSDQGKNAPLRRSSEVVRRSIPSSPAARRPVPGSTEPQNGSACEKTTKPSAYLTHQELPYGHTFLERQAQRMWEARKAAGSDDGISEDEGQPRISRSRNSDGGSVAPTGKPRPLRMRPRGSGDSAHASSLLVHARSIWAAGKLSDEEETESDASS